MPDNLTTVQQLTIPHSKFNLGDLVSYTIEFQTTSISYFGEIVSRSWINDIPNISYWEYIVESSIILKNENLLDFQDSDCVLENELIPWNGFFPHR